MTPQERADIISEKTDFKKMQECAEASIKSRELESKVFWLRETANTLSEAVKDVAICGSGCSHCCNIPLTLSYEEASVIANELKIKLSVPKKWEFKGNQKYYNTPCPFLKDEKCSIYEVRPFQCRIHFSMENKVDNCKTDKVRNVAYLNNPTLQKVYLASLVKRNDPKFADIRDFFKEVNNG